MAKPHSNLGSSLDDLLKHEGMFEEGQAIKETMAWQIAETMKAHSMTKAPMAALLNSSRSQVDRLLDPQHDVTLRPLQRAAAWVGRKQPIRLVQAAPRTMTTPDPDHLLRALKSRFEANMHRHPGCTWQAVAARLQAHPTALQALAQMEATGGEPDVVARDGATGQFTWCDCAAESPAGRRSLCFDRQALDARKENKPAGSAIGLAQAMGIDLLTEAQYRALQQLGEFDLKTSSWIATPQDVRALGGALFCDRRYGRVFTYHNGVQSYYAARGFRGQVLV